MPDKTKVWVCLVCKREYKYDDHHRCLDNDFQYPQSKELNPDHAHKRAYMREYMRRKRKLK